MPPTKLVTPPATAPPVTAPSAPAPSAPAAATGTSAVALLDAPPRRRPALSYELFPARSGASFERLQQTVAQLEQTAPDYVSVTSRTGYQNFARVLELTDHVLEETRLRPLVHLTSVGARRQHLVAGIEALLDRGVRGILALRGDVPEDHVPEEDEFPFARYLVELIREVERDRSALLAGGRIAVGVAAYPVRHPESPTRQHDIEVLVSKARSGADFAITQVFFDPAAYCDLVARARRAGVDIPLVPGFVPATDPARLQRLAELSGVHAPRELLHALETARDETDRRRIGTRFTVDLIRGVLDAGAPGLHLYTFNRHAEALDVLEALDLGQWTTTDTRHTGDPQ
ncbi:methylenetetrahydrofolate reductase [Brachybacterium sp. p3-SID957]|uniref:methylenetetrahydrofolate reductase n=1 Tax=Brachybacterium sp. p3-SID957 TaxID=2916049 RepID=UPI00223AF605|nr:methylenetetrahydrofolate reductase [Brachybacterium sp. p3-SID957]MCT1776472.1 methylenetetrahydrofolate reductase [Brachybacterium sp. p3-SID957]